MVEGYAVIVRLPSGVVVQALNVSTPGVSLSALARGTMYLFEVAVYNSGGVGPKASLPYTVPPGEWCLIAS